MGHFCNFKALNSKFLSDDQTCQFVRSHSVANLLFPFAQTLSTSDLSEESFRSTVAAVDKMFLRSRARPICQESRHAVLECYKKNKTQSLLCAEEVRSFANCVESARLVS